MMGSSVDQDESQWAMTTAEVFTAGRVASPLDEHHIKRTCYAHQISLVALSLLKQEAYSTYREEVQGSPELFELWSMKCSEHTDMFKYWSQIIKLELIMCQFVRSLRDGDFELNVKFLDELCTWFFAFDHIYTNYARWVPVHVKDLVKLPVKHREEGVRRIYERKFCRPAFTSQVLTNSQRPVP